MHFDNTYVKIDLDIISANFEAVQKKSGVKVMAIVKADAYGQGITKIVEFLVKNSGIKAVACAQVFAMSLIVALSAFQ